VDDLFPSEERTIIEADKVGVLLQPIREEMMVFIDRAMFGPGEYWQRQTFVKSLRESEVLRHTLDGREVEYGDIADITNKVVIAQPLTLTNRNLIVSYKKGLMKKKNSVVIIPLEYAVFVQETRRPSKHLEIRFEVSRKGRDVVFFDLWLMSLSDRQAWLDKLNQLIVEKSTSDRLPSPK
jgi:hypothetical protein